MRRLSGCRASFLPRVAAKLTFCFARSVFRFRTYFFTCPVLRSFHGMGATVSVPRPGLGAGRRTGRAGADWRSVPD